MRISIQSFIWCGLFIAVFICGLSIGCATLGEPRVTMGMKDAKFLLENFIPSINEAIDLLTPVVADLPDNDPAKAKLYSIHGRITLLLDFAISRAEIEEGWSSTVVALKAVLFKLAGVI